jgi:hypothetical protein
MHITDIDQVFIQIITSDKATWFFLYACLSVCVCSSNQAVKQVSHFLTMSHHFLFHKHFSFSSLDKLTTLFCLHLHTFQLTHIKLYFRILLETPRPSLELQYTNTFLFLFGLNLSFISFYFLSRCLSLSLSLSLSHTHTHTHTHTLYVSLSI